MVEGDQTGGRTSKQPDLKIDDLEDLRLIGEGGFAQVYSALDAEFGRQVAVKVFQGLRSNEDRRRFERERKLMGSLGSHPNVVTPYRFGYTAQGSPYLVMEYLPLGSLEDRIAASGPMTWEEGAGLVLGIADAVSQAHAQGITHRDLKPANILLTTEGIPKLSDFGIAAVQEANSNRVVFSMAHCSPEAFRAGVDERDRRSDIYSLASTLYALVTGHPPFSQEPPDSPAAYMRRIENDPVPGVGSPLHDEFLARAMAKQPSQRPQTIEEFAAELRSTFVGDRVPFAPLGAANVQAGFDRVFTAGSGSGADSGSGAGSGSGASQGPRSTAVSAASTVSVEHRSSMAPGGSPSAVDRSRLRRLLQVVGRPDHTWKAIGFAAAASLVIGLGFAAYQVGLFGSRDRSADAQAAGSGPVAVLREQVEGAAAEGNGTIQSIGSELDAGSPLVVAAPVSDQEIGPGRSTGAGGSNTTTRSTTTTKGGSATTPSNAGGTNSTGSGSSSTSGATASTSVATTPTTATTGPTVATTSAADRAEAAHQQGVAAFQAGEIDAAIGFFDQTAALDPAHKEVFIYRSLSHRIKGRFQMAIADGTLAIANNPSNGDAHLNRGLAYGAALEYPAALSDLDRALQLKPSATAGYMERGAIYYDLNNFSSAVANFDQVISRQASNSGAFYLRGKSHGKLGSLATAQADLEKFLTLVNSSDSRYAEAQNLVAELKLGNNPF